MSPSIRFVSALARRTGLLAGTVALVLASTSSVAFADRDKAKAYYDSAEKQYNLGKFDAAVDLYTKAYEEWPEPGFLFNIAQAYRQAGNCKQALFFYKRFLSLKAADPSKPIVAGLRTEVEARIAELDQCVKQELANKPPDSNMQPDGTQPTTTTPSTTTAQTQVTDGSSDEDEDEDGAIAAPATPVQPKLLIVRAVGGATKLYFPGLKRLKMVDGATMLVKDPGVVPTQFAGAISAAYPIPVADKVSVDVGAAFSFMIIPLSAGEGEEDANARMIGMLATVGATLAVTDKVGARLELGAGLLHLGGLDNNPTLTDSAADDNTTSVNMFALQLGAAGEYAFTPNWFALASPAVSIAPPGSGLQEDASLAMRFDLLFGLGYRM